MSHLELMICGAGIVYFVTEAEAGWWVRKVFCWVPWFERMFQCPFCTGFWVGYLVALWEWRLAERVVHDVLFAFGTAIVAMVLHKLIDLGEAAVHSSGLLYSLIPADGPDDDTTDPKGGP